MRLMRWHCAAAAAAAGSLDHEDTVWGVVHISTQQNVLYHHTPSRINPRQVPLLTAVCACHGWPALQL